MKLHRYDLARGACWYNEDGDPVIGLARLTNEMQFSLETHLRDGEMAAISKRVSLETAREIAKTIMKLIEVDVRRGSVEEVFGEVETNE